MMEIMGSEPVPNGNANSALLPNRQGIGTDQDGRIQRPGSIDQRPSHHMREAEENLSINLCPETRGFEGLSASDGKEKGPAKLTDPAGTSEL